MHDMLAIYTALEDDKGIPEHVWWMITDILPRGDVSVSAVLWIKETNAYWLDEHHRTRLLRTLPFIVQERCKRSEVVRPPVVKELIIPASLPVRCGFCKGPFHEATGHVFIVDMVVKGYGCHCCYGRFAADRAKRSGWRPLNNRKARRLAYKRRKMEQIREKNRLARMENAIEKVYRDANIEVVSADDFLHSIDPSLSAFSNQFK